MATPAGAAGVRNKRKQPPNTRDQPSKRRPAPPSNSSAANKQKLLNRAVGVLHGEILNGQRVKAPNDIPRILNSHAADYLKSNPFEHLKTADHLQIFIDVTNIANSAITDAPPPPILASTQQPTPETERIATPEEEDLLEDDGPLEPLEGVRCLIRRCVFGYLSHAGTRRAGRSPFLLSWSQGRERPEVQMSS